MNAIYALGRICLPLVFIAAGIQKAANVDSVAQILAGMNIPVPDAVTPYLGGIPKYEALGYLLAALEIICGLMVLVGLKARWGALGLVVFTACTIFFVHHFWDMEGALARTHQTEALKNLAIIGGLLLVVAVGSRVPAVGRTET